MKKLFFALLFVAVVNSACCKILPDRIELTGRTEIRTMPVSEFSDLVVSSSVVVVLSNSVSEITIETDSALMEYLRVEQTGNKIKVGYPSNISWKGESVNRVTIPAEKAELTNVRVSGASIVEVEEPICTQKLVVTLSGASLMYATSHVNTLDIDISGSSHAYFNGEAENLKIFISGASGLHSDMSNGNYVFDVTNISGSVSGASMASVHSDGKISVNLSGASSIAYTGRADISKCHCSDVCSVFSQN